MEYNYILKLKIGFLFLMFSLLGNSLYAQLEGELIPFVKTYPGPGDPTVIRGDMKVIGNSILGIQGVTDDGTSTIYSPNEEYNGNSRNNGVFRGYIDIDSDPSFNGLFTGLPNSERNYSGDVNFYGSPRNSSFSDTGTFSSSAAELSINNPLSPPGTTCSTVVKAFLYWGAMYEKESNTRSGDGIDDGPDIDRPDCTRANGDLCEFYTDIKILPPGANEYIDIKYDNTGTDHNSLKSDVIIDGVSGRVYSFSPTEEVRDETYACVADVTSLFNHLQNNGDAVEGNWTVANVRAVTARKSSGSGGGWSLVVVYEDPLSTFQKNISMFEGYVAITRPDGQPSDFVEFNITGFETIPAGPVNVDLATISLEGDIGIYGDQFQINDENDDQTKSGNWVGMTYPGQDASNFFDCSIYSKGPIIRYPNSSNTLGYDSDHFALLNPSNEYISNSDSEADFRIYTEGDAYGNFFNSFAIEVIAPDLEVIKKVFREDGSEFSDTDEVSLGETIEYEITITNKGNDDAVAITFEDLLPIHTVFVDDEITLDGTVIPIGDITRDDTATSTDSLTGLTFDTTRISFDILDELLEIGESVVIRFKVDLVSDCRDLQDVCTNRIQNQAGVSYSGEFNDNEGTRFEVESAFDVNNCLQPDFGPTLVLSDQDLCAVEVETVSQCTAIVELEGGEGFAEYRWFYEGVRLTTNADDGSPINSNDNTIRVDQAGTYTVDQIKSTSVDYLSCRDVLLTFEVDIYDPLDPPADPFEDFGEPLDPVCADDNTEITRIQLCNSDIDITTDFPDGTVYSWQKYDEALNCSQSAENCPYSSTAVANCYVEESTTANFTLSDEGSYKLTVTITGGCEFDYFFDAVPIDIDPILNIAGGGCEDDAVFTVTGVDFTTGNAVNYTLEFEITNNGVAQTFPAEAIPPSTILNSYTLNRVAGESYTIKGIVTPDVDGSCSFDTENENVEFVDFSASIDILTQATCAFVPDGSGSFDPTLAEISVTATDSYQSYLFNLINTGTGTLADSSGSQTDNTYDFGDLDPENNYEVQVFGGGETTTPTNCFIAIPVTGLNIPIDFSATANVIKDLSCEPAEVEIDVEILSLGTSTDPSPELTYTISGLPNIYTGDQIIYIDDESNRPASADEDDVTVVAPDGREINYLDLSVTTELTILIISPESNACILERLVTINPYDAPTITVVAPATNILCNGLSTGQIEVEGLTASGLNLVGETYEITAGPELRPTQTSSIFSNLPAGDYTIQVADDEGCTATVDQSLTQPDALVAPVITNSAYTCENDAIISITTATQGGTTPYSYELFKDGVLYRTLPVAAVDITTANAELANEDLTEGTYDLRVTDDNNCTTVTSNELIIEALPVVNLTELLPRNTDYQCTTPGDTPLLEITVETSLVPTGADTIEGYRISTSTDASLISAAFTNTTGIFDLPSGTHIIEVRTTNTLCTEIIEINVAPYVELTVDAPVITGVDCFGDTTGIIEFTVNNFDATAGYSYDLTFEGSSVASSALETTATITLTGLVASNNLDDYTLTVTDLRADNCTDPISLDRTIPGPTEPTIDSITAEYDCENDNYVITIEASGGTGSGYSFTTDNPATTQTSLVFTLPAPGVDTTVNVGIEDSDNCDGATTTVDLDAIPALTANLDPSSNLCNIAGTTPTIVVDVTSGEGVINYQLQGTTNIQVSTVTDIGQFTVANPEVTPGTYVYEIFDDNHTELSCAATISYTIDPLFEVRDIEITQPDCSATAPVGSLPTDGASVTFSVQGGDGTYTYAFTPNTVIVANSGTATNPIFVFDDSFDGDTISITVNDGSGCSLVDAATITVNYPEAPTLAAAPSFAPIDCNGGNTILSLDPGAVGAADNGNYEYSFDNGSSFETSANKLVLASTVNYVVRNITTQCILTGSVIIGEPDAITLNNGVPTNITCSAFGNVNGSYQVNVIGGTGPYTYELYTSTDGYTSVFNPPAGNPGTQGPLVLGTNADFTELPSGSYEVRVTDDNNCTNSDSPIFFNILPTPDAGISDFSFVADCTNKVTLFFEVVDGSSDGDDFFISPTLLGTPIDPSIAADDIYQIGDALFPTPPATFTPSAAGILNQKVYAISNLDFDIVGDFIVVLDNISTCTYSKEYDTVTSNQVSVSATAINAGACDPNSGAVDVIFSTVVSSTVDLEVFRVDDGTSVFGPSSFVTAAGVSQTEQLTGLPVGNLRVRVQQTGLLQCNATAPFSITVSPPLDGPNFVDSSPANCNDAAQLEVSATNGNEPYTFAVVAPGTNLAAAELLLDTDFTYATGSIDFSTAPASTFVDANGNVDAAVFVRDFSGCTAGPYNANILAFPAPDVTFEVFATNECDETGPFTFEYTINNYDATQTYTLTVDGGAELTLPNSAAGTYEVTTRGDHDIILYGSEYEFCTVTETVNVPDVLLVEANLSEPDCEGNILELVVEVTGGYDSTVAINRQLTYVLSDGGGVIATLNSTSTNETFTSGVGVLAGIQLVAANTNYQMSVTDTFDSTVPVGTERTCIKTDSDSKPNIAKPTFVPPTLTGLTCGPTTSEFPTFGYDGIAQINIAPGYVGSVTYELYEFPDGTSPTINATTYAADIAAAGGSDVTAATVNGAVDSLFEGLRGGSEAEYIVVALATGQNCPVISPLFTIPEPVLFTQGFIPSEVVGTCEPFRSPTISIDLDTVNLLDGNAPYYYRITGLANSFTEFNATTLPLEIAANVGTFNVEFTDASRCNIITLPITLQEVKTPEASIVGSNTYSCNTPEETVTITVTNGAGAEEYSIINTQFIDVNGVVTTPNTPGNSNNPPVAGIFEEDFTLTQPGLYEFEFTNVATGCSETIAYNIDELEQLTLDAADNEVLCNGDTTTISFEVSDYMGDFNYEFVGAVSGAVASGTVSDFGSATPTVVAAVEPTPGSTSIDVVTGIITVDDLEADVYTISITTIETTTTLASTNILCNASIEVEITEPDALTVGIPTEIERLSCVNGSAIIEVGTVDGGTPPYTYELLQGTTVIATNDTGVFDQNVTDPDGNPATSTLYFIRVTDANTCTPEDSGVIAITTPQSPDLPADTTIALDCEGDSTSITASIAAAPPITATVASLRYALFIYDATAPDFKGSQFIAPQASNTFNMVFEGDYLIEVTDDLGCADTQRITITEPAEVEFLDPEIVRPISCGTRTEGYRLSATGGTGAYTFERYAAPYTSTTIAAPLESNATGIFDIVDDEKYFRVVDANGCYDVLTIDPVNDIEQVAFELDFTTATLCFGEVGGFVDIKENTFVTGGVGDYQYNLYLSGSAIPLDGTTTPAVTKVSESAFSDLPAGSYVYEVISGTGEPICTATEAFTINQHPELTMPQPNDPSIGCPGEADAIIRLQVTPGIGVGPFVYGIAKNGEDPKFVTVATDTEEALFEFLSIGDYRYFVTDNGTGCNGPSGFFTVTEPEPLSVVLDTTNSQAPICEGQTGTREYDISGGRPPYYAVLISNSTLPEPTIEELTSDPLVLATYIVPGSDDVLLQPDLASGIATVPYQISNLLENNLYRVLIFDSGNGLTGDDLRLCDPLLFEFEFDTEDLGNYEVADDPNCNTLNYTVGIDNNNPDLNDEDLIIRVFTRDPNDGSDGVAVGNLADGETLIMEDVPPGTYNVYLESTITNCTTVISDRYFATFQPFTAVQFVTLDNEGNEVQPFRATNEINVYQLQAIGGVNPNGRPPYTYEATYVPLDGSASGGIVDVDDEGLFKIEETGYYTFKVIDNFGDEGVTCFDLSNSIGINAIDIDVPNVFNPSSSDPTMNTWYPENLTTSFTRDVSPIIDPNPNDGINPPAIPGLVTTTDGTITGGTIIGGTTAGGIITGGTITGGSTPVAVTDSTTVTESDGTINTVSIVTTGGITDTNGNIVGGTSIITTTTPVGVTTVFIATGVTITGGTVNSNGTVTGGTITEESSRQQATGTSSGGVTTYTIVTGGTIIGGETNGITTTGGTTVYSNTTVDGSGGGAYVTTDGVTTGGITSGGATNDAFVTMITVPIGGTAPSIEVSSGVTVTGGTVTGASITGATITGGTLSGGERTTEEIEFLDYENMQVFVFDRYGRLLKEIKGIKEKSEASQDGWDGTYQGNDMPSGDYWYLIQLNDPEGREFTGHFTLYRR